MSYREGSAKLAVDDGSRRVLLLYRPRNAKRRASRSTSTNLKRSCLIFQIRNTPGSLVQMPPRHSGVNVPRYPGYEFTPDHRETGRITLAFPLLSFVSVHGL